MTKKPTTASATKKASFLKQPPHLAVEYDEADIAAVKAVYRGDATPEMQKRCMDWIMKNLCLMGGVVFSDKGNDVSNFMAGRRFPAIILANLIQMNSPIFNKPN